MLSVSKVTKRLNKYTLTVKFSGLSAHSEPDLRLRVYELVNDSGRVQDPVVGVTELKSVGLDEQEAKLVIDLTGYSRPLKLKVGVVKELVSWLALTEVSVEY